MGQRLRGVVQSGANPRNAIPLRGAEVTLFAAGDGSPSIAGRATSARDGSFTIDAASSTCDGIFYVSADVGRGIVLLAVLGPRLPDAVTINELTTVAAAYSCLQFFDGGAIRGDAFGLRVAAGMNANLVSVRDGVASRVMTSSPNANETSSLQVMHTLANLLALSVIGLSETRYTVLDIARNPARHIDLDPDSDDVYEPALQIPPETWTLAVKVNDSGSDAHPFGGPANLVFDRRGRAWITNNVVQGQTTSTRWSIVLEADGRPASISPFTGGGLLGPGFGIDLDREDRVWIGNFGWGGDDPKPSGSVSLFTLDAQPLSPEPGFQDAVYKVQQTVVDGDGNVWLASYGNHRVVVYRGGDPKRAVYYEGPGTFDPFGLAIARDGTAWVTNSNPLASSIAHFRLAGDRLELLYETQTGQTLKGIVIDSTGNLWVASGGDDRVYVFDAAGKQLATCEGGGISGPWGVSLDGDDNVWVANFGPLHKSNFHGRLSLLAGPRSPRFGHPISPSTGYTCRPRASRCGSTTASRSTAPAARRASSPSCA